MGFPNRLTLVFFSTLPFVCAAQAATLFGGIYAVNCTMHNSRDPGCEILGSSEKTIWHTWIKKAGMPLGSVDHGTRVANARITLTELSGDVSRLAFSVEEQGESPIVRSVDIPKYKYYDFKGSALVEFTDIPPTIDGDDRGYSQFFAVAGVANEGTSELTSPGFSSRSARQA